MNKALTTGTMNQQVMALPDYSNLGQEVTDKIMPQITKMSPMDSLKAIFEDIRDGIDELVSLTKDMASPSRDDLIGAADVAPPPDEAPPEETGGGGFGLEMPQIGPKTGLALMLVALTALFKYGDEIKAGIETILPYITGFIDLIGPQGALFLGLSGLAALIFPKTFKTLLGVGKGSIKLAFGLLKTGFTTMKDAITSMPGLIKGAYSKGKELLGGAFGLLKSGFNSMKTFVMTTVPNALAAAYGGAKGLVLKAFTTLKTAFTTMRLFILNQMIPALASAYGGAKGKLMGAVTKLAAAFTALKVFLLSTMVPAIAAIAAPIAIPLALVVAGVAAAVAVFYAIKDGIDEFKKSLDEGDSMLVAIIEGVSTALLTLVTLPITLIKNFVAWVAEKLGFEGIAEKLKEFNIVTFIKDGVKNLVLKAKDFVLGLFNIDFKKVLGKFVDIGAAIGRVLKGIALGSIAAVKAAFPGGESPMEAFRRVYDEVSNKGNDAPKLPEESDPDDYPGVKSMDARRKEELEANKEKIQDLYYEDMDEDERDDRIFQLEQRNRDLYQMLKIENPDLKAAQEMSEANQAPGSNVVTTINTTDASNTNNTSNNSTNTGGLSVTGKDSTAQLLANVGYGEF